MRKNKMKKTFLKTIGAVSFTFLVLAIFAQVPVFTQEIQDERSIEAVEDSNNTRAYRRRIVGLWEAQVTIRVCATGTPIISFPALGNFNLGGTFQNADAQNPTLKSGVPGIWSHVRGNRYRFAFKFFRFDAAGNYIGTQVVRHELELNSNATEYASAGGVEFYDVNGNLTGRGCSTTTATRFE
jgi:hypothetical protein